MSTDFRYIPISSLCEGCLSSDRKLTLIYEEEVKNFFRGIVDSINHIHQLSLCWECIALVRKILKYMQQVRQAHEFLIKYMISQAKDLKSLSNLSITAVDSQEISQTRHKTTETAHLDLPFKIETTNSFKNESNGRCSSDDKCKNDKDYENVVTVKIERQDDDFGEAEAFCDDDKVKAVLSDERRLSDDFNDSDDEPLGAIKKMTEILNKRKGRPKNTEKHEAINKKKVKEVKKRRRKKEKYGVVDNARIQKKLQQLNVASGQLEMVILSWKEVAEERQQTLTSPSFTRLQYKCYECVIGFSHKSKLDNHRKKHEPSAGSMVCEVCGVRCGHSSAALAAHLRRHRVRWRCILCGGSWSRADVAADHSARAHGAPAPTHTCTLCGAVETTLGKLRRHLKVHAERQKCELCGKTFSDRTSLRTHLFIHKGEKEFACPRCDKKFLFKKAMEIHLVTHDQSANLYCHECDLNFKNKMSYYQHIKYNLKHIDPAKLKYACELCDKKFAKASRLHEHNLGVHLKITPFRCTIDDCDVTKKVLEGHIRTHTGERPFKCVHCPSTFGYEAALYNHNKLVHLKIKNRRPTAQPNPVPPIPNPVSLIPNPVPLIPNPVSLVPNHLPLIPNPVSVVPNPVSVVPIIPEASSGWQLTLNIANEAQDHTNVDIT